MEHPRKPLKQADPQPVATQGNRFGAHGKEGVDGSSPSEGLCEKAVDFVSDDPTYAGTMTMTWEVTKVDGGTRVDNIADNVPDGIAAKDHAAGLASSLMNLAEYLER